MLQAGAAGYLNKNDHAQELVSAIRRAACGQKLFTQEQRRRALQWRESIQHRWTNLTTREQGVLQLLAQGLSNTEIADTLSITIRTVETHLTHIMKKLDVDSRLEVVVWVRDNLPEDMWKAAK